MRASGGACVECLQAEHERRREVGTALRVLAWSERIADEDLDLLFACLARRLHQRGATRGEHAQLAVPLVEQGSDWRWRSDVELDEVVLADQPHRVVDNHQPRGVLIRASRFADP